MLKYHNLNPNNFIISHLSDSVIFSIYLFEDEETELSMWVSKDLPADLYEECLALVHSPRFPKLVTASVLPWNGIQNRKKSKERSLMTVKEVDKITLQALKPMAINSSASEE